MGKNKNRTRAEQVFGSEIAELIMPQRSCTVRNLGYFLAQRRHEHTHTHPLYHSPFLKCKVGAFYQFCVFTADTTVKHLQFASLLSFNHSRTFRKLLHQLHKKRAHSTSRRVEMCRGQVMQRGLRQGRFAHKINTEEALHTSRAFHCVQLSPEGCGGSRGQ